MKIIYQIQFDRQNPWDYDVLLDPQTCLITRKASSPPPEWAALEFQQCPNCPLTKETHPHCPVAVNIASIIRDCGDIVSHTEVHLKVTTPQRIFTAETTAQKALSSLMGLVIATSACPHTLFFRPMARFHLPLATHEETIFRAISSYLVLDFLGSPNGDSPVDLQPLLRIYENMQIVNENLAKRIQKLYQGDAPANAVISLHILSCVLPVSLQESLDKLRSWFAPILMNES